MYFPTCLLKILYFLDFRNETCNSAARLRTTNTHWYICTNGYEIPRYDHVWLILYSSGSRCSEYIVCLARCSREVQLRISFRLACCHILLVVNLFFPLKVMIAGGQCLRATVSPVHNMTRLWDVLMMTFIHSANQNSHPLAEIDSAIRGYTSTQSEILTPTEISACSAYRVYLNQCSQ
jgi:hypothetical protein